MRGQEDLRLIIPCLMGAVTLNVERIMMMKLTANLLKISKGSSMAREREGSYFTIRSYDNLTSTTLNGTRFDQHQHQAGFPTYFLAAALSLHAVMREVKLKIAYIFPEGRQRRFTSAALVHELENHRITFLDGDWVLIPTS